jgi:hypothetical protein
VYEARHQQLLSRARFAQRLAQHALWGIVLLGISLLIGMAGYRILERLDWPDAFLNAAMLLGGMGPVNPPTTVGGKIFAGVYALYAGLVFLVTVGVVLAPVLHRLLHKFHAEGRATDA